MHALQARHYVHLAIAPQHLSQLFGVSQSRKFERLCVAVGQGVQVGGLWVGVGGLWFVDRGFVCTCCRGSLLLNTGK